MKQTLPFVTIALALLQVNTLPAAERKQDTVVIKHRTDGLVSEWNVEALEFNKETGIKYAVDNDADKLYVCMKIDNQRTQNRMMLLGMKLFIDTKGKKRASTNIEFPIKKDPVEALNAMPRPVPGETTISSEQSKAFREQMVGSMMFLKRSGFEGQEQDEQLQTINLEKDINIAFGWDEAGIMDIEYEIPLSSLGLTGDAYKGKNISIGIQLNGIEFRQSNAQPVASSSRLVAVPAGSRTSGTNFNTNRIGSDGATGRGATGGERPGGGDPMFREQSFWIKHAMK